MAILRRMRSGTAALLALAGLAATAGGCSGSAPPVPLRPEPVAYADTLPIIEPAVHDPLELEYLMQDAISGEVSDVISVRNAVGMRHEAVNITRFDGVVNSAWFEHRNDVRRLTPQEVFHGPTTGTGPDTTGPLIMTSAKLQGVTPGFHIRDSRGDRYVVKFDPRGFQHLSSSASIIGNRLAHAAGYNVPEDYIFVFRREHLQGVAEGATYTDREFVKHPLSLALADTILAGTDPLPDGRFLAVASKYVPGPPKGPFHFDGTRRDDPNDYYRHQHRRDLRGLLVVSAWLNHVDMRFMNTLDAYVAPGYLRHYLIDFGASLGSASVRPHEPREGVEYNFDFWATTGRMLTLGFYQYGWEGVDGDVIDPSIGWLAAETFDPVRWKPNWPNGAFRRATVRDTYWGAKLVGSFTDEQIRAAVTAGRLPNEFAADTLTKILIERRDRIVASWYRPVSPIERPAVDSVGARPLSDGFRLTFEDFGIRDGAWTGDGVTYQWHLSHDALGIAWSGELAAGAYRQELHVRPGAGEGAGRRPDGDLPPSDAIAILRILVRLPGDAAGPDRAARIFLRWDVDRDRYTVVGLEH